MKIARLRVENILGCKEAELDWRTRHLHIVGGRNYQGKSSFLQGIPMALGGTRRFPKEPLTNGEEEGLIELDLVPEETDNVEETGIPWPCTVTRRLWIKPDGSTGTKVEIRETGEEDAPPSEKPQDKLNKLAPDGLVFDPLTFVAAKATEQANILRDLVGLDFRSLDEEREKIYVRRGKVNAVVKQLDGQVKGIKLPDNMPAERVDVGALTKSLKESHDWNRSIEAKERDLDGCKRNIADAKAKLEELEAKRVELQNYLTSAEATAVEMASSITTMKPVDLQPIEQAIAEADETNRLFDLQEQSLSLREQRKAKQRESDALTKKIKEIDGKKKRQAAEAHWPIEGLGFDQQGGVTWNEHPITSLSSAERLDIGVAIAIDKNPQFPVVIIWDGSLLDDESLTRLTKRVVEKGAQCIVERVGDEDECHLVFEDGYGRDPEQADLDKAIDRVATPPSPLHQTKPDPRALREFMEAEQKRTQG